MATTTTTTASKPCVKCGKTSGILVCIDCEQTLCFQHVSEHRQEIDEKWQSLMQEQDRFSEDLSQSNFIDHPLFTQIDRWENDSFNRIRQTAEQAREDLGRFLNESNRRLIKLSEDLSNNLRLARQSNDLSEKDLIKWSKKFSELKKETAQLKLVNSSTMELIKVERHEQSITEAPPGPTLPANLKENHSKEPGLISIRESDPFGHFIVIEHCGSNNDKVQDMVGWTLRRKNDSSSEIIYRFPNDFVLKPKSHIRIVSRQAYSKLYLTEKKNILVAETVHNWGSGVQTMVTRLLDANGNETDCLTQSFK